MAYNYVPTDAQRAAKAAFNQTLAPRFGVGRALYHNETGLSFQTSRGVPFHLRAEVETLGFKISSIVPVSPELVTVCLTPK